MLSKWANKFNFFSGYILGFTFVWLLPRSTFDQIAMKYYDIMEEN